MCIAIQMYLPTLLSNKWIPPTVKYEIGSILSQMVELLTQIQLKFDVGMYV